MFGECHAHIFMNGYINPTELDILQMRAQYKKLNKTNIAFLKGINPFYKFVAKNRLVILPMASAKKASNDKYSGFKVCFTGVRDASLEEKIVDGGGEICSGVSKKTTHLIVADQDSTSSKATKAKQLGIPVMTIDDFMKL